ncbi:hypothetical protein HK103_004630 [Boothiomyces macroporosus]|uniref:Peptidase A1 domain-containing protein n=1 Tax=Boothiomyces macroporosus TaxID=261099 RepID=A0AAD5UM56_9FUNG|nr:hypothetical protein HK103_004630 [Boothiomyces macroporosus]
MLVLPLLAAAAPAQKQYKVPITRTRDASLSLRENILVGLEHTVNKIVNSPFSSKLAGVSVSPSDAAVGNLQNALYTGQITVGQNQQQFNVQLDTGSSDLWLVGTSCQDSGDSSCQMGNQLDTSDPAVSDLHQQFNITYLDQSTAQCEIYSAPVTMGGLTANSLPIGAAFYMQGFGTGQKYDGLLGLGFDSLSEISNTTKQSASFFDKLGFSKDQSLFGMYLSNSADGDNGEIALGGVDSAKFSGNLNYVPVISDYFWAFNSTGMTFSVGSGQPQDATGGVHGAIPDSGTTLLMLENSVAAAINKQIGATLDRSSPTVYDIPCSVAKRGKPIKFTVNGQTYSIPPSIYVVNEGNGQCISGIIGGADRSKGVPILFGDVFMRSVYTVFDKGNKRIGFAPAVHN